MKPSDYLKKEYAKGYEDHGHTSIDVHYILGSIDVDEDKLDKRFIDKEELKEKIKTYEFINFEMSVNNKEYILFHKDDLIKLIKSNVSILKKEILKLLEE